MTPDNEAHMRKDWAAIQSVHFSQQSNHTPAKEFVVAWELQQERLLKAQRKANYLHAALFKVWCAARNVKALAKGHFCDYRQKIESIDGASHAALDGYLKETALPSQNLRTE